MKLSKIAVGIDFSPRSELAAKEAFGLARRTGAELLLLHAAPIPDSLEPYDKWTDLRGAEEYRKILLAQLSAAHDELGRWRERMSGQGPVVSMAIKDNTFADISLAQAASESKADLLVVGSEGRTGLARAAMGSVAEGVVRRSEVPVLVARGGQEPLGEYRSILVPMDFSPAARRALDLAVALGKNNARIDVFHVVNTDIGGNDLADALESQAMTAWQHLLFKYSDADVQLNFAMDRGSARAAILQRAAGHDLIVMGTHGRRGFSRLFLGSVAAHTVRHAPCSVATIHPPEIL
jgi:nucleotide-binding universal stress UspA family protein